MLGAAAAVTFLSPAAVGAFDVPPPAFGNDPDARKKYAADANPAQFAQMGPALQIIYDKEILSPSFFALSTPVFIRNFKP